MLTGREHEQQVIETLLAGARLGVSGVLAVTGEPGVGKTALLHWAEGRLDGFRVLRATGTEPEQGVPFAALLAVLRPALCNPNCALTKLSCNLITPAHMAMGVKFRKRVALHALLQGQQQKDPVLLTLRRLRASLGTGP